MCIKYYKGAAFHPIKLNYIQSNNCVIKKKIINHRKHLKCDYRKRGTDASSKLGTPLEFSNKIFLKSSSIQDMRYKL